MSSRLGSAICDAPQFDRKHIPAGICFSQNAIGCPNTIVSTPAARRYAAAESPYGPAPITTTSQPEELDLTLILTITVSKVSVDQGLANVLVEEITGNGKDFTRQARKGSFRGA